VVPPMPSTGSSSNCQSVMLCAMSLVPVLSRVASALTVADSVADSTSRVRVNGDIWPTSAVSPDRTKFLKPELLP
jgi:hypothetical protein